MVIKSLSRSKLTSTKLFSCSFRISISSSVRWNLEHLLHCLPIQSFQKVLAWSHWALTTTFQKGSSSLIKKVSFLAQSKLTWLTYVGTSGLDAIVSVEY
jgi:hypothetical protein